MHHLSLNAVKASLILATTTANRCLKFKRYKHTVLHQSQSCVRLPLEKNAPEVTDFSPLVVSLFTAQAVKEQQ